MENIGVIGAGNIANFHLEALIEAKFEIKGICAKFGSNRARKLADRYSIPFFYDIEDILKRSKSESYLVCVDSQSIDQILSNFIGLDIPILIEKPGPAAFNLSHLEKTKASVNWFVAYNRRFYKSIGALKTIFSEQGGFLNFSFVESGALLDLETVRKDIINNTCHGLDLIKFIIGEYTLADIQVMLKESIFEAKILNSQNRYIGRMRILFGAPTNTFIELITQGEIFIVQPLEVLHKFNTLTVTEPTIHSKIRSYTPSWVGRGSQIVQSITNFKPGFLEQAKAFKNFKDELTTNLCSVQENESNLRTAYIIIQSISEKLQNKN